ncbi:MAG: DUF349 domain-containing protein [Paludibacteraceae bacterium]|nr:DUF349 domain-containing protein [Paludibacteraceae bacterium]
MEKAELVEELRSLLAGDVAEIKEQVDELKSRFYRLHRAGAVAESASTEIVSASDKPAAPTDATVSEGVQANSTDAPQDDNDAALEQEFKQLLGIYKTKRQELLQKQEAEMAANLAKKQAILDEMRSMAESETADVSQNIQHFRELQAEWKTIGQVSPQDLATLQKQYSQYQEQFYDLVKINNELREYDFKKNLEQKNALIAAAEALKDKADIVEANRMLQKLHEEWAEIGPVAKELREDIWTRFKEASTVVNKRHQEYFEQLHTKEKENLEKKEALVAQVRDIDIDSLASNKDWDEATQKVTALQAEWKTIGFAPKKNNQQIYDEFREYTNRFFAAKTAYYKGMRDELTANLKAKRAILAEAESLKDSTEWRETTDKMIELQKRWKEIGPVPRKYSEELWKQFTCACDQFFENRKSARKADHESYLQRKAAKAEQLEKEEALSNDRRKLIRMYEAIEAETKTMENNMGFFSGKATKLLESMQKKIDANKKKMAEIETKLKELDD